MSDKRERSMFFLHVGAEQCPRCAVKQQKWATEIYNMIPCR